MAIAQSSASAPLVQLPPVQGTGGCPCTTTSAQGGGSTASQQALTGSTTLGAAGAAPAPPATPAPAAHGEHTHGAPAAPAAHDHNAPVIAPGSVKHKKGSARVVQDAIAGTKKYRKVSAAKKDGYVADKKELANGSEIVHFKKKANTKDGKIIDPKNPEVLLYRRDPGGKWTLAGVMYRTPKGTKSPVVGAKGVFHQHAGGPDKMQWISGNNKAGGMLHVWFTKLTDKAHEVGAPEDVKTSTPWKYNAK